MTKSRIASSSLSVASKPAVAAFVHKGAIVMHFGGTLQ